MKITQILPLSLILAAAAFGQVARYSATSGDVVLSGAGTTFTIQQPAANGKQVTFEAAVVYCSVACQVTQAQNGTFATATAGTANPILPFGPPAAATVWTASNVGSGTAAGGVMHFAAGERSTIDLSKMQMGNTGTGTNYSITISSISGTANVTIFWAEK